MEENGRVVPLYAGGCTLLAGAGSDRAMCSPLPIPGRHKKKRAIRKALHHLPAGARVFTMDETALRLLPPLRAAWAQKGKQAKVPISGRNAQGTLYCTLNLQTGRRITRISSHQRQNDFHAFLRQLRSGRGGKGPLVLLLDQHASHTARASVELARELNITLLWLPTQCPSLNPVEHLWRGLKTDIAANRQFPTIAEQLHHAEAWIQRLSPLQALRKAGLLAPKFWLHSVCKNLCQPT